MRYRGTCHCGATAFTTTASPATLTRCNCTFCSKRGALWLYADPAEFHLETPSEAQSLYSPTMPENRHHFCSVCGCTTFSDTPDWASGDMAVRRIAINARLLDDFDIATAEIVDLDGRNLW